MALSPDPMYCTPHLTPYHYTEHPLPLIIISLGYSGPGHVEASSAHNSQNELWNPWIEFCAARAWKFEQWIGGRGSLCLVWVQSLSLLQALGVLSVSRFFKQEAIEATQIGSMMNIMSLACFVWSMSFVLTNSMDLPKSQGKGY